RILRQVPWSHLDQVPVRLADETIEGIEGLVQLKAEHVIVEALGQVPAGAGEAPGPVGRGGGGNLAIEIGTDHREDAAGQVAQPVRQLRVVPVPQGLPREIAVLSELDLTQEV